MSIHGYENSFLMKKTMWKKDIDRKGSGQTLGCPVLVCLFCSCCLMLKSHVKVTGKSCLNEHCVRTKSDPKYKFHYQNQTCLWSSDNITWMPSMWEWLNSSKWPHLLWNECNNVEMAALMLKLPDLLQNGHTYIKMDTLMLKWQHLHWKWTHLRNPST